MDNPILAVSVSFTMMIIHLIVIRAALTKDDKLAVVFNSVAYLLWSVFLLFAGWSF
ncbi:hypothetical protein M1M34_gp109 [Haloarcula tailed virus 2]|uniref:Uncharacterized protein n=1 Tax=Haloarcula tailed virus 2 TaxID=2877989 RepID=A0AAE8Y0N7_9CAUD|nr:hypothetical protein M1M34_gp109 [Haloarcula tailed virus 2]UBF23224.1 hypothetical protein HATV-2_gp73 [Haloarcula tailed virus 2]